MAVIEKCQIRNVMKREDPRKNYKTEGRIYERPSFLNRLPDVTQ